MGACLTLLARPARADEPAVGESQPDEPPSTFAYTTPSETNYLRGLYEFGGVLTLGYLQYITEQDIVQHYNVNYTWHMYRRKLLFQELKLDTNQLGTNFVGHAVGGTSYYMAARSNQYNIAEAFGIAVLGSLTWEYIGEVREIVSINDMIVTPLTGVIIGEPLLQLSAFFDRSSPALRNRVLAVFFAPLKSLNDALDGRTLARTQHPDAYGFPQDEWHQFDLMTGVGNTWRTSTGAVSGSDVTQEWRYALASRLVRLPDYDGPGKHSLTFSDGNVSSLEVSGAVTHAGIVDLDVESELVTVGYYNRDARRDARGKLWGNGTQIGLRSGYQFTVHDYTRDGVRPVDVLSAVEPLGLLFEHRGAFGVGRIVTRLAATSSFAGVRSYALRTYRIRPDAVDLPFVLDQHLYYYGVGGRVLASVTFGAGLFEAQARLRFEAYSGLEIPASIADQRASFEARVGLGLPVTPARISAFTVQRERWGQMGPARAAGSDLSMGLEIGARY